MNGEEPSAFDAVPLRRATPDQPDRAGEDGSSGTANAASPDAATASSGPTSPEPTSSGPAAAPIRHRRTLVGRGAQALRRLPPPHRVAAAAARRTARWAGRPSGRVALMGVFIAVLLALTAVAGIYLVPAGAPVGTARPAAQDSAAAQGARAVPSAASAPATVPTGPAAGLPSAPFPSAGNPAGVPGPRPADALRGWSEHTATLVGIPQVALQAYGYAELVVAQTTSSCHLSWTTLAGIGRVESNHGSSTGATLYPDGQALPAIVGPALDGQHDTQPITDTDHGQLDNDTTWDHAIGPMQFLPSTWRSQAVDADNDGIRNPNDIDDAALAAANLLCSNGRDLNTSEGWQGAVAAYNRPPAYKEEVFHWADQYGRQSHP